LLGLSCSIVFISLKAEWLTPLQTEIDITNKCTSYTRLLSHRQKLPRFCKICFFKLHESMYCFWGYSAHLIWGGSMNFRINILKSEIHLHTHLKVQFQPHSKHFISMTKPTTEYCLQKKLLFILRHQKHKYTLNDHNLAQVPVLENTATV
jgi:lipid II:glycine glycyltransferase (peptidoglycan interpeptide bridge formation enzyme)